MQLGQTLEAKEPIAVPHIFIPMSDIFAAVYRECKKLPRQPSLVSMLAWRPATRFAFFWPRTM
jgi:hypothetical protein